MNNDVLEEKKKKILLMEEEINALNEKKKKLKQLKIDYYIEYFNTKRDEYALLTDIPSNPTNEPHILHDYSGLNIDLIGRMICELFKKYENKDLVCERRFKTEIWDNAFHGFTINIPLLVIGMSNEIYELKSNENNIIIEYDEHTRFDEYPTDNPVAWSLYSSFERSNYCKLIDKIGNLSFDYKNYEFIKELIYSLAYYQKEHDIKWMNEQDTFNVYKKIYKN